MHFQTKNIKLKNGKEAIFRSPTEDDGWEMLEFLKKTDGETEFLSRYPEERASRTVEYERNRLKRIHESENSLMILCIVDGSIIGNCQIVFNPLLKMRHRATLMIVISEAFWGLGIGSKMFEEMIEIAKEHHLEQLELQVMGGNQRGIWLYHKFGFKEVGRIPQAFKLKDGSYQDEVYMIKTL